ncbi:MAG: ABC transporter ATP-binding protein [Lachnospiraceae bacterium]
MIQVENLVKNYGNHKALKGINFHVENGSIVGLLGANGAGKSTTMNILTGYLSYNEGSVKIGGYDILKEPIKAKKQIGYLPEIPPLYMDMTVDEYLKFAAEIKGLKKDELKQAVDAAIEATKIEKVRGRLIKNLSKGYKQRVGLAQAILGNPPLLILDEPTVGLDPNQIIEIREWIKSLSKNHTIILSSHILSEVNAICDYVIIIDQGKVVAQDTPENLAQHFSDQSVLKLQIKGEKDAIEETLNETDLIKEFTIKQSKEEGIYDITANASTTKDIRDDLFFIFASKKLPVVKMEHESLSLEEVFLKLTNEELLEEIKGNQDEITDESKKEKFKIKNPFKKKEKNIKTLQDSESGENKIQEEQELKNEEEQS